MIFGDFLSCLGIAFADLRKQLWKLQVPDAIEKLNTIGPTNYSGTQGKSNAGSSQESAYLVCAWNFWPGNKKKKHTFSPFQIRVSLSLSHIVNANIFRKLYVFYM